MRWQYLGPYLDSNGMTAAWDFASKSLVSNVTIQQLIDSGYTTKPIADGYAAVGVKYITPEQAHLPHDIVSSQQARFHAAPGLRLQPAFRRQRSLVVRGGYGMYYFPIPARTFSELRFNPPMTGTYRLSWNDSAYTVDALAERALAVRSRRHHGRQFGQSPSASRRRRPGVQMTALNPDLPTARAHEYNFTIEHEVIKDTVVRAGFIGTAGRNLEMMELFNRNPVSNYVWYATTGLAAAHRASSPTPPAAPTTRPSSATYASTASSAIRTSRASSWKPSGASAKAWPSSSSTC